MKTVIQRVTSATLSVHNQTISTIGQGLVVYLGVMKGDTLLECQYLAKKISHMRIFEDENGKLNRSVLDVGGSVLLVSQFTLLGDCKRGNRPDFTQAEAPDTAKERYLSFAKMLQDDFGVPTQLGVFGADMQIEQHNDGPVTILLESKQ